MSRRDIARRSRTDQRVLSHEGRDIPIRTQRNRQARNMTLRIDAKDGCAVLTLPTYVGLKEGMGFARSKAGWLAARLDELAPHTPFVDGARVPFQGHDVRVRHFELAGPDPVLIGDVLYVPGSAAMVAPTVREWLMEEARRALSIRVAVKAAMIRRNPPLFRLTDPKARWGSCSSDARLCFSWRLIMAPAEVLDYVVAHEVAHLVHLDHSHRFHGLVRRLSRHVDYATHWLDTEGARLLRYG